MGCSNSTSSVAETPTLTNTAKQKSGASSAGQKSGIKYPASEAFIIPLDKDCEMTNYNAMSAPASIPAVNKIPPKRIQKLMEQAATAEQSFNLKTLEEKLNKADERRKEFLQKKVEKTQLMSSNNDDQMKIMNLTKTDSRDEDYSNDDYKNNFAMEV